jgi:hypothetical protein
MNLMSGDLKIGLRHAAVLCVLSMTGTAVVKPAMGQTSVWASVGTLDCIVGPSIGLVAGARQHARCAFKRKEADKAVLYIGRLEKMGRTTGLPSGGKLIWTVFAASDLGDRDFSGQYRKSVEVRDFDKRDAYTMCKVTPQPICLQPVVGESQWKPNLAPAVSGFKLDADMRRKSPRGKLE